MPSTACGRRRRRSCGRSRRARCGSVSGPPLRQRHQAGRQQLPVAEPGADLVVLAPAAAAEPVGQQFLALDGGGAEFGQVVPGQAEAGDREVAAGRHRVAELGRDPVRVVVVLDVVQHREQQQADRPVEVDQPRDRGVGQDVGRIADVGVDDVGVHGVAEQRLAVRVDDRVVVDVDDVHARVDLVRDLADVARRGQPGPDVDQLGDAHLADQVAHHPAQERAIVLGGQRRLGRELHRPARELPVGREVVLAADEVVVHPGDVRLRNVDIRQRLPIVPGAASTHSRPPYGYGMSGSRAVNSSARYAAIQMINDNPIPRRPAGSRAGPPPRAGAGSR